MISQSNNDLAVQCIYQSREYLEWLCTDLE